MKKILSVILSFMLIVGSFSFLVSADTPEVVLEGEVSDYPVVMIPGYSACWLYTGSDPETGTNAWNGLNFDDLLPNILNRISDIGLGLGAMAVGNADYIARVLAEEIKNTWPLMGCNPDGTSTYALKPYYTDPAHTNSKWLDETDNNFCRHDRELAGIIEDYIGKENIFNFNVDWRMGVEDCAKQLNDYIKAVKEYTGKDKVNIHAISQGGQIAATYLALYCENLDVDNAVLSSPAIGGSGLASDLLLQNVNADEQTILEMVEHVTYMEENYEWLLRANELGFLDDILNSLIPYLADSMGYWPSIWDFVSTDKYEECKAKYLSDSKCAPLVKQSDRFHYDILPTIGEKLRWCNNNGMNVSIITGTGYRVVSGMNINSDAIIQVPSATGATCPQFGTRFADGYVQENPCDGKYKLSPDMSIDASTAYLPDNTWFSDGNFHAWTYFSPLTKKLHITLLLTDSITSVYSDSEFPQFLQSDNVSKSIVYRFNNSDTGFISGNSTGLEIKNVFENSPIKITAIYCDNLDIVFKTGLKGLTINPGETITVPFRGSIPTVSGQCAHITVCYSTDGTFPLNYRTIGFTVMNGTPVSANRQIIEINRTTPLDKLLGTFIMNILDKLGLKELLSLLCTVVYCNIFQR